MSREKYLRQAVSMSLAFGLLAAPVWMPADLAAPVRSFSVAEAAAVGAADVVLVGTVQSKLGAGTDWAPADGATIMQPVGNGKYQLKGKLPKGNYEFKVAIGGSWNENYGAGGARDGGNISLKLAAEKEVTFTYDSLSHEMILLDRLDQTIYYKGSLQYSLDEEVVAEDQEIEITEEMQKTRLQNEALIQEISPIVVTLTSGYITYPLYFLQANYPGHTFSLSGSAETGYILQYAYSETNADVVYATAAILKYYLGSSAWFSTVVSNCLSIAQSGGYAPYAASGDYNIPSSNVQSYAQACINSYGLGKQAANVTSQIWTYGKNEINANRPFILWINSSTSYSNHAVTAFGWYNYIDAGINNYCFFKVNDGYSTAASRYVYVNTCSGTMTKIV